LASSARVRGIRGGLLERPEDVAVDASGRVYVTDRQRISVFSPQGAFLRAFGKDVVPGNPGSGFEQCTTVCKGGELGGERGELGVATGLAVDADGLVYVADARNNRISVYNQQGSFLRAFGKDVDPDNDGTGFEICVERCRAGEEGGGSGELSNPAGIAIDNAGVLWVADARNNRVSLYNLDGAFLRAFGKRVNRLPGGGPDVCSSRCGPGIGSGRVGLGALSFPVAVALDAAGNVHVGELLNRRVSVFSPDLAFVRALGEDVVPGNAETGFEVCTSATGCKAGALESDPGAVLRLPVGVAVAADGDLYVSDLPNQRVSIFSPAADFLGAFGKDVVPNNAETGFEECAPRCKAGVAGAGPGEMTHPAQLTFDCRGALYVAELENGRVQRFGAPGTDTPPCDRPAALSQPFGIMKARRHPRRGTATLTISVPRSAQLRLRGRGIRPLTRQLEFAGRTRLPVRPTRATLRSLRARGQARVRAKVTYWPWGGRPRTRTRAITLRKTSPIAASVR
jgi:DNA-binding beta-propeller fold protein YncE